MTTKTVLHASRAVSDIIRSCVMAGVRGGHASVELAAQTAALITMSRYATYRTITAHQTTKTKVKITRARSGPKLE